MFPCSLGLLRAASPTGRALRAPPATTTSSIRNGRLAAPDGLQYFLAHWAYYGLFRAPRAAFVRPYQFPLKSCGFSGAETVRKRFLLWNMGFSDAKIAPSPPYTPPGTIKTRKGFGSTIRNSRLAALPLARLLPLSSAWSPLCVRKAHLRCFLLHWAHRRLLQPLAAPPLSPSLGLLRPVSRTARGLRAPHRLRRLFRPHWTSASPVSRTARGEAPSHWARASCAPLLARGAFWVVAQPYEVALPKSLPLAPKGGGTAQP